MSSAKIDRPLNTNCITRRKSSRHEQISVWHMSGRMWSSHKQIDVEIDEIGPSLGQQVRNHVLSRSIRENGHKAIEYYLNPDWPGYSTLQE